MQVKIPVLLKMAELLEEAVRQLECAVAWREGLDSRPWGGWWALSLDLLVEGCNGLIIHIHKTHLLQCHQNHDGNGTHVRQWHMHVLTGIKF